MNDLRTLASSGVFVVACGVTAAMVAEMSRHAPALLVLDAPPRLPEVSVDDLKALVLECEASRAVSAAYNMALPSAYDKPQRHQNQPFYRGLRKYRK